MTDTQLHDMIRAAADRIPTSHPPMGAIVRQARRRRAGAVGLAVAALLVVAGTATAVPRLEGTSGPSPAGQGPGWDQGENDVPLFLPTYGATAGELEGSVTLRGELLLVDEERCVVIGPDQTPVVWPRGYEGVVRADGTLTLLDEDRQPVADSGDVVELGGAWTGPASWSGEPCLPDGSRPFMVQARPSVE